MLALASWTEELPLPMTLQVLRDLAYDHALKGGPHGLEIAELISSSNFKALALYELDYDKEWEATHLIECRQALAFFQKLEPIDIGLDKAAVAETKFWQAEESCCETNLHLRLAYSGEGNFFLLPEAYKLIELVRRKIARVLGEPPSLEDMKLTFGPGATTLTKRKYACPQRKFSDGIACSESLAYSTYLTPLLNELPHWLDSQCTGHSIDEEGWLCASVPVLINGGVLTFVPKNAKTYRSIMIEPVLNSLFQQGIRRVMEKRLRVIGLDIRDQSRNARLARRGSIDGTLATLDLSSASDLISYELVKLVLPEKWFELLRAARTESVQRKDGSFVRLEKFSSMGNAYTFPLESLLFWAISTCAPTAFGEQRFHDEDVGVYGDDIIIPTRGYGSVSRALSFLGLEINSRKSFAKGSFRESCGHDYYKGIDVRPFYQKNLVSGLSLFTLHNFYYRALDFARAEKVRDLIPRHLRLYGPDGYGDGHLLSDTFPQLRKKNWVVKGYRGFAFDTFTLKPMSLRSKYPGDWVTPLYTIYVNDGVPLHELFEGIRENTPTEFGKHGAPVWSIPGTSGYVRTSIYTLG